MGVAEDHVNVCEDGDQLVLTDKGVRRGDRIPAGYLYVDGVRHRRHRPRRAARPARCWPRRASSWCSSASTSRTGEIVGGPEIITKGWVHEAEADGAHRRARRRGARRRSTPRCSGPSGPTSRCSTGPLRRAAGQVHQQPHQAPADDRPRSSSRSDAAPPVSLWRSEGLGAETNCLTFLPNVKRILRACLRRASRTAGSIPGP